MGARNSGDYCMVKDTLKKNISWKSNCTYNFWANSHQAPFFLCNNFFNPTIGKHMAPSYQKTLTFDQYLINSRSNLHVNLVYRISLPSLPTLLEQTANFISDKKKTRTKNLYYRKAGCVPVNLSERVGVKSIQKVVPYFSQCGGSQIYLPPRTYITSSGGGEHLPQYDNWWQF